MSKETPTITKEGFDAIISELKADIDTVLKSEKDKLETLSKAHPGEETSSEPPADTSAVKTAPESSGPEAAEPAAEGPSAAPETDAPPAAVEGAEEAPVDPAAEMGPIDPEQLKAEYCQMPLEDLQAHYLACKEALVQAMAAQAPAPAPAAAPVAGAPAPAAAAPAAPAAPVAAPAAPVAAPAAPPAAPPVPAFKSEEALKIATLEKSLKDQDEAINKLVGVMTKVMSAPLRKSVTSLTEVIDQTAPKVELKNMTKAQLDKALMDKIASGKLTKSETDLICDFDSHKVKVDALAPLFA